MNSNFLFRSFRILLFPFALIYGGIVKLRNWAYNKNIFKSTAFNLPIINIGNLSVGGTGKSPMVEFLLQHLQTYKLATLSRGYRRKTKGYILANASTTAIEIGDEPFMFYQKYKNVAVAVGEDRVLAIPQLLQDAPSTQVILLDDAMQHRAIKPSFNIVLTDFNNLYIDDFFLPTGDLRDERKRIQAASIVVVTKCHPNLTLDEAAHVKKRFKLPNTIEVFFSTIQYTTLTHLSIQQSIELTNTLDVLLVTGIANPKPIEKLLEEKVHLYEKLTFRDHHLFTIDDIKQIEKQFAMLTATHKIIVTTQKDAVRLLKFGDAIQHLPIYILPIKMQFLFHQGDAFLQLVTKHIQQFNQSQNS